VRTGVSLDTARRTRDRCGMPQVGRGPVVFGPALAAPGAVLTWTPGLLSWVGRLPGDVRAGRVTFLVGTSVAMSRALRLLLHLLARLLR
jgi:hypothetical protein